MARAPKSPPIVAELGRPETREEKAARLTEQSRKYRARKTINNLILSLGVTVLAAFVIFLMVPHADQAPDWSVDYVKVGTEAQPAAGGTLIIPVVPDTWKANQAKFSMGDDKVPLWRVGFITKTKALALYRQAVSAPPSWVSGTLANVKKTGSRSIGGLTWDEYDNRSVEGAGNLAYALVTVASGSTFVLNGTASNTEFDQLATAVATALKK